MEAKTAFPEPNSESRRKRLIVALSGATGAILGIRLLQKLQQLKDVETHLIISKWAQTTISHETKFSREDVIGMADCYYHNTDVAARPASGSAKFDGMLVIPCSMKTLSSIANGYDGDLITRAASVTLKERRRLVLAVRETPLTGIQLEHMLKLHREGAVIAPPVPAFYHQPQDLDDVLDHTIGRILDLFGLDVLDATRWKGMHSEGSGTTI